MGCGGFFKVSNGERLPASLPAIHTESMEHDVLTGVTSHHLCHFLLVRSKSQVLLTLRKGVYIKVQTTRVRVNGGHLQDCVSQPCRVLQEIPFEEESLGFTTFVTPGKFLNPLGLILL